MSANDSQLKNLEIQQGADGSHKEQVPAQPKEKWQQEYERDYANMTRLAARIEAATKSSYLQGLKKQFEALQKPDKASEKPADAEVLKIALENYAEFVELHEKISQILKSEIGKGHVKFTSWTGKFGKIDAEQYKPDFFRGLKELEKELIEADLLEEGEGGGEEAGGKISAEAEDGGEEETAVTEKQEDKAGEEDEDLARNSGEQTAGGDENGDEASEDAKPQLQKPKFTNKKGAAMLDTFWDRVPTLPPKAREVIYGRLQQLKNPDEDKVKAVRSDFGTLAGIAHRCQSLIDSFKYVEKEEDKAQVLNELKARFEIKDGKFVDFKGLEKNTPIQEFGKERFAMINQSEKAMEKVMNPMDKMKLKAKKFLEARPHLMALVVLIVKLFKLEDTAAEFFPEMFGNPQEKKNWEAQVEKAKTEVSKVTHPKKGPELVSAVEALKIKGAKDGAKDLAALQKEAGDIMALENKLKALKEPEDAEAKKKLEEKLGEKLGAGKNFASEKAEIDGLYNEEKFADAGAKIDSLNAMIAEVQKKPEAAPETEKPDANPEGQKLASDFFDKLMNDLTANELTILKDISVKEYIALAGEEEIDDKFDKGWLDTAMPWNNEKRIDQFKKAVIAFLETNGKEKAFLDKDISMKEFLGRIFSDKKRYDTFATLLKNSEHGFDVSKVNDFFKVIEINSSKTA